MNDYKTLIDNMMREALVLDIETSASYKDGTPINIKKDFDAYVMNAEVKWIGFYSYKYQKYYNVELTADNRDTVKDFIKDHKVFVSFNGIEFDCPILYNNGLMGEYQNNIDLRVILGDDMFHGNKNLTAYMPYKLGSIFIDGRKYGKNSLNGMAHAFDLETKKGDIDYNIFFQDSYTKEERASITEYLQADVEVTKQLFELSVEFWRMVPEMDWLYESDVLNWSWLRTSIASLTYKAACKTKGVEATYGKKGDTEDMGGRAIAPPNEENWDAHYLDETSKYLHIFAEFNLFNEIVDPSEEEKKTLWHGNEMFKVKGYYNIMEQGVLELDVLEKLRKRFEIKRLLKNHNLQEKQVKLLQAQEYMIKIFLNSLYGAVRSSIFEQIHSPNAGYDCCYIGQQIHEIIENEFKAEGFEAVGGFTDSWFFKDLKEIKRTKEEVIVIAARVMDKIKKHMPFPAETHKIGYECFMNYVMFQADPKTGLFKKNNYCYITEGSSGKAVVKVVGFPIKKSNGTALGKKIYREYLESAIIDSNHAKFETEWIRGLVMSNLEMEQMIRTYDCKAAHEYKPQTTKEGLDVPSSNIYAQVSRGYTDSLGGEVSLIKNRKAGQIGNAIKKIKEGKKLTKADWFYGTLEECKAAGVTKEDLDLSKIYNELAPFVKGGILK